MKNFRLLALMLLTMAALTVWSAPALPGKWQVRQKDGTLLTIEQMGDEFHHWTQTADGTLLVERDGGYYVADIDDQGRLTPTLLLAHDAPLRGSDELAAANRQKARKALFHNVGATARRAALINNNGGYLQHMGSPRVLVILAEYQDVTFTVNSPVEAFEQYLNGTEQKDLGNHNTDNINSIRQYFNTVSHGQFTPQFDLVGPVTLPQEMKYYGAGSSNSENMSQLGKDAIALVEDQVDLTKYDNDGDGRVELVYVIHAGYGQNQGGAEETMWAKVSTVNMKINETLKLTRLGCNAELFHPQREGYINGTGVFCHEFSHTMGLPDLYPTNTAGRKVDNQSMERWDLMDNGLYLANGFRPIPYTAWEQEVLGWIEMDSLKTTRGGVQLMPLVEDGKAYKIPNPDNDREFIVIENMQKRGICSAIPNSGLLIYHVAYPYTKVNMGDNPNNTAGKPSVALVPACGVMMSGFLIEGQGYGGTYTRAEYTANQKAVVFPGTENVTELTDEALLPNYKFYATGSDESDVAVGSKLLNIAIDSETGAVTFDYIGQPAAGDVNNDGVTDIDDVVALVNYILGEPAERFVAEAADVNGDSNIDVGDVVAIINIILGGDSTN